MVGSLIRYNAGGGGSLGLVVDAFVLDIPRYDSAMATNGDTLIRIEWLPTKGKELRPSALYLRMQGDDDSFFATQKRMRNSADRNWYNLRWFKVESAI
jgi:hypothetical protein